MTLQSHFCKDLSGTDQQEVIHYRPLFFFVMVFMSRSCIELYLAHAYSSSCRKKQEKHI